MSTLAIIKTGGKQYKVKEGDTLTIEKLKGEPNTQITLNPVLLVADTKSGDTTVGTPFIEHASVKATILAQSRHKKIKVVKYKPKTRYKVVRGHRQNFTRLNITNITF